MSAPPDDLRRVERWVLWRWAAKNGRPTKVPTRPSADGNCNPHDPRAWMEFDCAAERLRRAMVNNTWPRGGGLGLVMAPDDDLGCVDLDGCRDAATGKLAGWARRAIAEFNSYTEVSPSGAGLHIFARGAPEFWRPKSTPKQRGEGDPVVPGKEPACEVFVSGQYIAYTGERLDGTPGEVRHAPEAWAWLARRMRAATERPERPDRQEYAGTDLPLVAEALTYFTSDDVGRERFVMIGALLRAEFGEDARETWLNWMARSPNNDEADAEAMWDSFHEAPHSLSLGTVFWLAEQRGWMPPWRLVDAEDVFTEDVEVPEEPEDAEVVDTLEHAEVVDGED